MEMKEFVKKRIEIIKVNIKDAENKKERRYHEGKLAEAQLYLDRAMAKEELKGKMDEAEESINYVIKWLAELKETMREELFVPNIRIEMHAQDSIDEYPDDMGFIERKDNGARRFVIDIPPYKRFK